MEKEPLPGTDRWWELHNDDKEVVRSFFQQRTDRNNRKFGLTLWTKLSPRLQHDKELALLAVKNARVDLFYDFPEIFRNDKDVLLATFKQFDLNTGPGWKLWQQISPSLQNDKQIIIAAIEQRRIQRLGHLPEAITSDKDVIVAAYKQRRISVHFKDVELWQLPVELRDDKEVVMLELFHAPMSLGIASSRLRDDEDVVRIAVMRKGEAMKFASARLRNESSFVLSLIENRGREEIIGLIQNISARLRNDQSFIMAAVRINGEMLKYASDDMKANKEIVMAAVRLNGTALDYASDDMKSNKEIVIAAVQNFGISLRFASKGLQNDFDVCIIAVRQNWFAFEIVSEELKSDQSFVLQAVSSCFRVLDLVKVGWRCNPDVVYEALQDTHFATSKNASLHLGEAHRSFYDGDRVLDHRLGLLSRLLNQKVKRNSTSYVGYYLFLRRVRHLHGQLMAQDDTLIACLFPSKRNSKRAKVETGPINVKKWVTQRLERFWLVQRFSTSGAWDRNIQQKVVQFAGYDKMIEQHQSLCTELQTCEHVINRLIELKWKIPNEN